MRRHLGKKLALTVVAAVILAALAVGAAVANPVLQPGQTSAPNMSGTCTDCHTYAKPAQPVLFSRPFAKAKVKHGRTFAVAGYIDPSLCSAANATVTVSVQRRNARGRWVAQPGLTKLATVADIGKYAGKVNYKASLKIKRVGKYRVRAALAYLDASSVAHTMWSKPTTVTIKK